MKKTVCLFAALIMCLTICLPAFAVIAENEAEGIRVTVSKKGGAPVYEYSDKTDEKETSPSPIPRQRKKSPKTQNSPPTGKQLSQRPTTAAALSRANMTAIGFISLSRMFRLT